MARQRLQRDIIAFRMPREEAERLYHCADTLEVTVSALLREIIRDRTLDPASFSGPIPNDASGRPRTKFLSVED